MTKPTGIGHHLVFECLRFEYMATRPSGRLEAIRADFPGDKDSWEALGKADWRKDRGGDEVSYFVAVEEFVGYLYRAMTGRSDTQA